MSNVSNGFERDQRISRLENRESDLSDSLNDLRVGVGKMETSLDLLTEKVSSMSETLQEMVPSSRNMKALTRLAWVLITGIVAFMVKDGWRWFSK